MALIDIDFEVYKALTNLRQDEQVTYNDVIRGLLKLPAEPKATPLAVNGAKPWIVKNVSFPAGSEFRAEYGGKIYSGSVRDGKLELGDGHRFSHPSPAAKHITGNSVNGWRFWQCRLPDTSKFVLIESLRGNTY